MGAAGARRDAARGARALRTRRRDGGFRLRRQAYRGAPAAPGVAGGRAVGGAETLAGGATVRRRRGGRVRALGRAKPCVDGQPRVPRGRIDAGAGALLGTAGRTLEPGPFAAARPAVSRREIDGGGKRDPGELAVRVRV